MPSKAAKSSGFCCWNSVPCPAGKHDGPGADRVDPDPGGRQFLSGGGRQLDLRRLGGGIGGARRRARAGDRGDDHHRAAAGRAQVDQPGPDQLGGVARVEGERGGEVARAGVGEVAAADRPAGVGHQVIQAAEGGRDLADGAVQRERVGDVGRHGRDLGPALGQTPGGAGQAVGVAGDEPDGRPLGGQHVGDGQADAPASPGDQRAAAAQAQIHPVSPARGARRARRTWPGDGLPSGSRRGPAAGAGRPTCRPAGCTPGSG